jgi:hypothetical protein
MRQVSAIFVESPTSEGKKGDMAGTFDSATQLALVFGAGTGLTARADFAFFGNESAQDIRLFVINCHMPICTELAYFRAGVITTLLPPFHFIIHWVIHKNIYSILTNLAQW